MPKAAKTAAHFEAATIACEQWFYIEEDDHGKVRAELRYQRGDRSAKGRGLIKDIMVGGTRLLNG